MAHEATAPRKGYAVWIAGPPGCGYNSVGNLLRSVSIETWGYRDSHQNPWEWKNAVEVTNFKITDPTINQKFYHGYGDQLFELENLPWKVIAYIRVSEQTLTDRVLQFRRKAKLRETEDAVAVQHAMECLHRFEKEISGSPNVEVIDGEQTVKEIAKDIRSLIKLRKYGEEANHG